MSRSFHLNGEAMVSVRGGAHMSGAPIGNVTDLGLSSEAIAVTLNLRHTPITADDFGKDVPADIQAMLVSARVQMTLVHYDGDVLDICLDESMGGGAGLTAFGADGLFAGERLAPAGRPLGGHKEMFWSGNHFISLNITCQNTDEEFPYRFRRCYIAEAVAIPLGTRRKLVQLAWECLPLFTTHTSGGSLSSGGIQVDGQIWTPVKEVRSSGCVVWDHDTDEPEV